MRNLKKVMALMLVGVLTLALLIPGAGAYVYPDQSQINAKYVSAINMLYELAIMQGNNGEFRPASNLTRAEFSKMVYVVANRGSTNANNYQNVAEVSFQDYVSTDWFAGYVNWAAVQGVVEGKAPTRFDPQGNVTGYEAAKMLLVILGYRSNIEGYTGAGWTLRVLSDAQGAGLLDDLEDITDLGAPLTREQAAQILYNAVFAGMVEYKEQPSGWVVTARYVPGKTETQIETPAHLFFTLETLTGTYTANEWVALTGGTTDEGKIRLSDVENADGVAVSAEEFDTTLDVDLLGQKVTVYVRLNSRNEVAKLYGSPVATNEETIFTVNYSDIKAASGTGASTVYTYTTGGKTYTTTTGTALYKDFVRQTTGLPATAGIGNESPARVFVDKNNNITQIFATEYKFAQLTVSSTQKVTVKPTFGGGANIQSNKAKEDFVIGADLIENNAYVLYSVLGSKYRLTAVEELTGSVTYIRNDQATIGGTAYSKGTIAGADTDFAYAERGKEKVYFVFRGALLGSRSATSSDSDKYAVVIRSTYDGAFTGDGAASVYLLTDENRKVAYTINTLYKFDSTTKADLNADTIGKWTAGKYEGTYPYDSGGDLLDAAVLWTGVICKYTLTGEGSSAKVNLWPQGVTSHNVITTKGQSYVDIDGGVGRVSATTKSVIFVQYKGSDEWIAYKGNALPTLPIAGSASTNFPFSYIQKTRTNADNDTITVGYIDAHTDANPGDQGDEIILRGILTSAAYLTLDDNGDDLIGFDLFVDGAYKTYYADGDGFNPADISGYKAGMVLTATVVNDTKLGDDSYKIGRYKIANTASNKDVQAYAGYVSSVDDSFLYVADAITGTSGAELGKTPKWTLNDVGNLIGFKFTSSTKVYLRQDGTEGRDDDYELADSGALADLEDYTVNKAQVVVTVNGGGADNKPLEIIAVYVNDDQWEF